MNMQHFSILSRHALKIYSKIWNQVPYYFCNELSKVQIKLLSADKLIQYIKRLKNLHLQHHYWNLSSCSQPLGVL